MKIGSFGDEDTKRLERDGMWFVLSDDRTRVMLARSGGNNTAYTKMLRAKSKPYTTQISRGTIDLDTMNEILIQCFAATVIKDWDAKDADGNDIPFSQDAFVAVCKADANFWDEVQQLANTQQAFSMQAAADRRGNSSSA